MILICMNVILTFNPGLPTVTRRPSCDGSLVTELGCDPDDLEPDLDPDDPGREGRDGTLCLFDCKEGNDAGK